MSFIVPSVPNNNNLLNFFFFASLTHTWTKLSIGIGWYIENELEHGVITKDTKEKFIEIANKGYSDLGVDATKIHIQNIIDEILR